MTIPVYQFRDYLSRVVGKPAFCICENKDADQLSGDCEADQRLWFRYTDSTIPLLSKPLAIFCGCTARFVSDLVGNPEDRFSHNDAHLFTEKSENDAIENITPFGGWLCDFLITETCPYKSDPRFPPNI